MFSYIKTMSFISLLAMSFVLMSCNDTTMTDVPADNELETLGIDSQSNAGHIEDVLLDDVLLDDVFVSGRTIGGIDELTITDLNDNELGTFTGRITNLKLTEGDDPGTVEASGRFIGTLNGERFNQTFEDVPLQVYQLAEVQSLLLGGILQPILDLFDGDGTCPILFLDIGPIFVDLLGLVIDIDPIVIEITGERGPGNLLGNLLCGLLGILDP